MPRYVCEVRDATGRLIKKTVEAADLKAARQNLEDGHYTIFNIYLEGTRPGCVWLLVVTGGSLLAAVLHLWT